jgi:hypothetical protein
MGAEGTWRILARWYVNPDMPTAALTISLVSPLEPSGDSPEGPIPALIRAAAFGLSNSSSARPSATFSVSFSVLTHSHRRLWD